MGTSLEGRFDGYCDSLIAKLGHADRSTPTKGYLQGLMLPGGRKSVEPMAARVHPQDVRSAHQSMHHLVSTSDWSDEALLAAVAAQVVPALTPSGEDRYWIIDDTARCEGVGVPKAVGFRSKNQMAAAQIRAAVAAGLPRGTVLGDAAYGDDTPLRDALTEQGLVYALGIKPLTTVWWDIHQPAPTPPPKAHGRPRVRVKRDTEHSPINVRTVAAQWPGKAYRTVRWREGTNDTLSGRFARVRVVAANQDRVRAPEWLVIEWPHGEKEPSRYWLSTLPEEMSFADLVDAIKARWLIERDYLELKQELGLGHYEGRNWRGFHHHASLCIAAYGVLTLERLRGSKKNRARLPEPAVPEGFRPRGAGADAAPRAVVHRHHALSTRTRDRKASVTVPMLRKNTPNKPSDLITQ